MLKAAHGDRGTKAGKRSAPVEPEIRKKNHAVTSFYHPVFITLCAVEVTRIQPSALPKENQSRWRDQITSGLALE